MDNQHKLIKGYRNLTQAEIDLMNEIKQKGEELGALCGKVTAHLHSQINDLNRMGEGEARDAEQERLNTANPYFWEGSACTDLQVGIMKLVRAVAQPTTF